MAAYYNEIDPFAAAWLRELIKAGLIADGAVDERSIVDVRSADLAGFAQCHFFAGIGGWSAALRLAGWPDDVPAWTGSCPCQPFSVAGANRGKDDARHLWPQFRRLIRQCRPAVVFGEQVASKAGRTWLSGVFADLEALAYRAAGADLCGPSVGAFDIRQRLWFVADELGVRSDRRWGEGLPGPERRRDYGVLADASVSGWRSQPERPAGEDRGPTPKSGRLRDAGDVGHACHAGLQDGESSELRGSRRSDEGGTTLESGCSFWSSADWIPCRDGKARPVEPGTFPLAHGLSGRVGRLRGYGNAIKPQVAAEFIAAYLES